MKAKSASRSVSGPTRPDGIVPATLRQQPCRDQSFGGEFTPGHHLVVAPRRMTASEIVGVAAVTEL